MKNKKQGISNKKNKKEKAMKRNHKSICSVEKETWIITGDEYEMISDNEEYDNVFRIRPFGASCSDSYPICDFDGSMDEIENANDVGDVVLSIHPDEHNYRCVEHWRGNTEEEAYIRFLSKCGIEVEKI